MIKSELYTLAVIKRQKWLRHRDVVLREYAYQDDVKRSAGYER